MSLSAYTDIAVNCDDCGLTLWGSELGLRHGMTAAEVRRRALMRGWTCETVSTETADYCPTHVVPCSRKRAA